MDKKYVDMLVYLCAFTFMHVVMRAPVSECKAVAERVLKNV